ncbi:MAG: hypothetical protein MJ252_28945 [archaeon]|nr:hypothetical protein [archaeon]
MKMQEENKSSLEINFFGQICTVEKPSNFQELQKTCQRKFEISPRDMEKVEFYYTSENGQQKIKVTKEIYENLDFSNKKLDIEFYNDNSALEASSIYSSKIPKELVVQSIIKTLHERKRKFQESQIGKSKMEEQKKINADNTNISENIPQNIPQNLALGSKLSVEENLISNQIKNPIKEDNLRDGVIQIEEENNLPFKKEEKPMELRVKQNNLLRPEDQIKMSHDALNKNIRDIENDLFCKSSEILQADLKRSNLPMNSNLFGQSIQSKQMEILSRTNTHNVFCQGCKCCPIKGVRYKCIFCENFNFCSKCEKEKNSTHQHPFLKLVFPLAE